MQETKMKVLSEIDDLTPLLKVELCDENGRTKAAKELTAKIARLVKSTIDSYDDDGQLGSLEKDFLLQAIFALERCWYVLCLCNIEDSTRDAAEFSPHYPKE